MSEFTISLLCLFFGIIILVFVGYINWYSTIKRDTVAWIERKVVKHLFGEGTRIAEGIFAGVTDILLLLGIFLTFPFFMFIGEK